MIQYTCIGPCQAHTVKHQTQLEMFSLSPQVKAGAVQRHHLGALLHICACCNAVIAQSTSLNCLKQCCIKGAGPINVAPFLNDSQSPHRVCCAGRQGLPLLTVGESPHTVCCDGEQSRRNLFPTVISNSAKQLQQSV